MPQSDLSRSLGNGGAFWRPDHTAAFHPGTRAAARLLLAVDGEDPQVKRNLWSILQTHGLPSYFRGWQGIKFDRENIELEGIPGRELSAGQVEFAKATPALRAYQQWLNDHWLWSPHVLQIPFSLLEDRRELETLRSEYFDLLAHSKEHPEILEALNLPESTPERNGPSGELRRRLQLLDQGLEEGWGWRVNFLADSENLRYLRRRIKAGKSLQYPGSPEYLGWLSYDIEWSPGRLEIFRLEEFGWNVSFETRAEAGKRIRARRGRCGDAVSASNGSPPLDRVNGRRLSRPVLSHK